MPDTSNLEKLNRELEKSEKKLRKAINDEKALRSPKASCRRAVICASNEPNEYACIFTRRMPQQPTECWLPQSWSAPNHVSAPLRSVQGKRPLDVLHPCAGCRQLPFCGLAIWGHLALQAGYCSLVPRSSNGFCRCFAFQIGKICYHHCIIRHFQFRKCLPVNSNTSCSQPTSFTKSLYTLTVE